MNDDADKTVKESQPAPISSTSPGAGEDLLRAGIMQQPDQPGMVGKIGRFDVIKLLGQGGMGQVLLAREPVTNVKVAIKVLKPQLARDPASVHRFLTEARHAYGMGHPNILKVMEVSDSDDRPFYVVPYIEGGSLARRIGPQKLLPTETALDIARQVASALSYAHGRGIIHRDLKPANVLMDGEGRAYLTDFGLLRTVFNDSFVDVQQSSLEGTAPYMSPAMVEGKAEDTRCDIYSFGAMLYEMLTGQPPYTAPSVEIILKKIAAGPPEPILKVNPKASKELAAIAEWAMARELRDRYATMADVLSDLERAAKGKEPVGPRGAVGLGRQTRRNLAIAGAALVVVAMAVFVLSKMASSSKTGIASEAGQKIDLTSGLVAHFPLDGHVRDVTGNGHDGQIHGNVRYVNGPNSQAIDLDGSAWVTLPDEKFLDGSSNATVALWFFSRANNGWRTAIGSGDVRSGIDPISVQFDGGTGQFQACGFGDMVALQGIYGHGSSPQHIFQNYKWHFFAMTLESGPKLTTLRLYLDGELRETKTINSVVAIRHDRPTPTSLGAVDNGAHLWVGSLDDVRIYDRVLSPAEIQKLFTAGGTAQNLVVNGSFESPAITEDFRNLANGSTVMPGWTVGATGNVEVVRFWPASDGFNSLDLTGDQSGSISQDVLLTKGIGYELSFDMAYTPVYPRPVSLLVSIGGYSKTFTRDPSAGAPFWRRQAFIFTATNTGSAKLTFKDTTVGSGGAGSPVDNVSLIAVSSNAVEAGQPPAGSFKERLARLIAAQTQNVSLVAVPSNLNTSTAAPVPAPARQVRSARPIRRPDESNAVRLAKVQAMFKGKVTLRPDGRFEFFYDFSDPAQLDDWIVREPQAEWAVEGGWLVCKKNASQGGSDTRLYHKALYAGKEREISYDAQGPDNLAAGLFGELEDWRQGYRFDFSYSGAQTYVDFGLARLAITNLDVLDPKRTYHISAAAKHDSYSLVLDAKEVLKGSISPSVVQTGKMAHLQLAYSLGRYDNVRIIGALDPGTYHSVLFFENFEAGLDRWTGKNGGAHSGIIAQDPVSSGRGRVLTFTNLSQSGDVFTREVISNADSVEISFDYLGLAKPGSVPGDLGGFLGIAKDWTDTGSFFAGTQAGYPGVTLRLIDDGAWHRVSYLIRSGSIPSFHLTIEDFIDSRGVAGDAYFDNIKIKTVPVSKAESANLLANGDFELEGESDRPAQWSTFTYDGGTKDIKFELSGEAHSGKRSLAISSKEGGDGNWFQTVKVERFRNYRFSGWVKTENIQSKGGNGVFFNAHQAQGVGFGFALAILRGSNDWRRFETVFNALPGTDLLLSCNVGGRSAVAGKAWFDDLCLASMKEIPRIEGRIVNGSFEEADEGWPLGWAVRTWSDWAPKFEYAKTARTGSRSIRISTGQYRSGSWIFVAKVKRNTSYKLSGWIRTENLIGGARANLGVVEYFGKGNKPCFTEGLAGTQGWTQSSVTFPSGENDWIEIACQVTGAGDAAAGDAWFDDIELEEVP
jgi:hypothetical protein